MKKLVLLASLATLMLGLHTGVHAKIIEPKLSNIFYKCSYQGNATLHYEKARKKLEKRLNTATNEGKLKQIFCYKTWEEETVPNLWMDSYDEKALQGMSRSACKRYTKQFSRNEYENCMNKLDDKEGCAKIKRFAKDNFTLFFLCDQYITIGKRLSLGKITEEEALQKCTYLKKELVKLVKIPITTAFDMNVENDMNVEK